MASIVCTLVLVVCFFIFAFYNPDKAAWVGQVAKDERQMFPDKEAGEAVSAISLVNVHSRFEAWFLWGFVNEFVVPIVLLLAYLTFKVDQIFGTLGVGITGCWGSMSILAWFIIGLVWRFTADGDFASGTRIPSGSNEKEWMEKVNAEGSLFQTKSGVFMKYFYIVSISVTVLVLVLSLIGACAVCLSIKDFQDPTDPVLDDKQPVSQLP